MLVQYFREYSTQLQRDAECKVYGHAGRPVLYIPCQNGRFYDFENYHMADVLSPWIDSGQIIVFSIDTIDSETWSDQMGDPRHRIFRYEQWVEYIVRELAPSIRAMVNDYNGWDGYPGIIVLGCSLGATHAANLYFRFPDVFDGLIALSGVYTAEYGFGDYMDETVYRNSPIHYLSGLSPGNPLIDRYNRNRAVFCSGQGPWERPDYTWQIKEVLDRKGIHAWVDFWGYDSAHDWPWWYQQVSYFLPYLLG